MFVGVLDPHRETRPGCEAEHSLQIDHTVDFRCIRVTAREGAHLIFFIDHDLDLTADLGLEFGRRDFRLYVHEALEPFFLQVFGHCIGQVVGRRPVNRGIFETANAV
jgi:hypothetical protein